MLDDLLPNFGVRVGTTGKLSFFVMYRINGRRKRDTLGQFPIVTLAEARQLARQRLATTDPRRTRIPHFTPTVNFGEAAADFLQLHCAVRNKPRTAEETERLAQPALAAGLLAPNRCKRSERKMSRSVLDGLVGTPSEAMHALAAIRKFFNWARQRRLVDALAVRRFAARTFDRSRARACFPISELVKVYRAAEQYRISVRHHRAAVAAHRTASQRDCELALELHQHRTSG